jgi:hypothetical protein
MVKFSKWIIIPLIILKLSSSSKSDLNSRMCIALRWKVLSYIHNEFKRERARPGMEARSSWPVKDRTSPGDEGWPLSEGVWLSSALCQQSRLLPQGEIGLESGHSKSEQRWKVASRGARLSVTVAASNWTGEKASGGRAARNIWSS